MKAFMDKDFLLSTETAQKLFHEVAEKMPVLIITAISTLKRSQRTESSITSLRYGWAATITNGVR